MRVFFLSKWFLIPLVAGVTLSCLWSLGTYWLLGAGAVCFFVGLVIVIIKLIRRKADEEEEEKERPAGTTFSMTDEDSDSRNTKKVWVFLIPTVFSVVAILITIFSGPNKNDIIASVKADFEKRFENVQGQLATKANDSNVGQLKSDLGKVRDDGNANTASLTVLAGRMNANDQKIAGIQKSVTRARSDATVAREAAASASRLAVKTSGEVQTLAARQDSISDYFERKNQAVNDSLLAMNNRQQAISELLKHLRK